jgi:hypothetical protein
MIWRNNYSLLVFVCGMLFDSGAYAEDSKRKVVWDGFSFAAENTQQSDCSKKLHPSCEYLFSEKVEDRFAAKLYAINDDKYEYAGLADSDVGETLHLTITVSLEWPDIVVLPNSILTMKDDAIIGQYRLCTTLMLYSATSTTYMIENASGNCFGQFLRVKDIEDDKVSSSFIARFIDDTVEKIWLAEASQIIARRQKNFKSVTVSSVNLAPEVYQGDDFKRDRMRIYVAEKMSEQLSNVFKKPVIPPSVSGNGAMKLAFGDSSRNRTITLRPAKSNLHLSLEPDQYRLVEDKKTARQKEYFYSILKMTHESASGNKLLDGAGFYEVSDRPFIPSSTEEYEIGDSLYKNSIYFANLEKLIGKISSQFLSPDKKWIDSSVYKSDPKLVLKGFVQIKDALND